MKHFLLFCLFIPIISVGQSLTYWNSVLESDTSSLDTKIKKFSVRQMRKIVNAHLDEGPNELMDTLTAALNKWQGNQEQVDDICLMIVEI